MPEPLVGEEVLLRLYRDANYAGDGSNRRSRTGFFIFLNEAPIYAVALKQTIKFYTGMNFQSCLTLTLIWLVILMTQYSE